MNNKQLMSIPVQGFTTVAIRSAIERHPPVLSPNQTVIDAITQMSGLGLIPPSCIVVVESGRVLGLLTDRDVVRLVATGKPLDRLQLSQVTTAPTVTLKESAFTDVSVAIDLLQRHGLSYLVIVDDQDCFVGLVTAQSLLQITHNSTQTHTNECQTEAQFRRLTENVPGMVYRYVVHPDGSHESSYVSSYVRDIFELEPAAVMANTGLLWSKIHPDDIPFLQGMMATCGQDPAPFDIEHRLILSSGKIKWVQAIGSMELQENGDVVCDGVVLDISDRKQTDQQESLLRKITQKIRESLDLQTIFETACREIRQLIQADRVGIFKFYPESNFDDGELVAESVANGFMSVLAKPIHDHCFGTNYSTLYSQGRYYVANDIYHDGISKCHTDVLAQLEVKANMVMPLTCGSELWGLLCIHQCSGTRNWQQHEIDLSQQISHQLSIALQQANLVEQLQQELIDRQQAQLQLTERNEELARATRLKDEFLANMSHELRTPLNAILGMTEGLQEEVFGSITPQQLKCLQTIEHSGSHLLELINDILDVAKIESGQIELDLTPTAIEPLCQSSLAFIKQQAFKKNIHLGIKLPEHLPDLLVDERRIRQVLINLLNNAVKFTPNGGRISVEVKYLKETVVLAQPQLQGITRVSIDREVLHRQLALEIQQGTAEVQEYLKIDIIDTGIGIAPEYINKLFQPFIQIDSALNRQYAGTGLGLALVKRIVEMHGGAVELTSELGVGSCFSIKLPCAMMSSSAPGILVPDANPVVISSNSWAHDQSPLILLAEDNEANISTLLNYLEMKGYRLLVAYDGREAIALAQSQHPDLILMDIQMPVMDGLEAMQHIRRDPDLMDIPMIALTALAMTGDRERCLAAGANDYISKPIKLKQLTASIQSLLSSEFDRN